MIFYEYDTNGWLIGWHGDANRPNSTLVDYAPIQPSRARFVEGAWVEDPSREQAQIRDAMVAQVVALVQSRLDSWAASMGYDNIHTCRMCCNSKNPKFKSEGQAGQDFYDATWAAVEGVASTAQTIEEVLAVLPPAPERPTP